jgi:hypothetical protein
MAAHVGPMVAILLILIAIVRFVIGVDGMLQLTAMHGCTRTKFVGSSAQPRKKGCCRAIRWSATATCSSSTVVVEIMSHLSAQLLRL